MSPAALSFRQGGARMTDETVRRAWAYLSRVAESPCADLSTFVADVGPVEAATRIKAAAWRPRSCGAGSRRAMRSTVPPRIWRCWTAARGRLITWTISE